MSEEAREIIEPEPAEEIAGPSDPNGRRASATIVGHLLLKGVVIKICCLFLRASAADSARERIERREGEGL
jgi:hypothetical protein